MWGRALCSLSKTPLRPETIEDLLTQRRYAKYAGRHLWHGYRGQTRIEPQPKAPLWRKINTGSQRGTGGPDHRFIKGLVKYLIWFPLYLFIHAIMHFLHFYPCPQLFARAAIRMTGRPPAHALSGCASA